MYTYTPCSQNIHELICMLFSTQYMQVSMSSEMCQYTQWIPNKYKHTFSSTSVWVTFDLFRHTQIVTTAMIATMTTGKTTTTTTTTMMMVSVLSSTLGEMGEDKRELEETLSYKPHSHKGQTQIESGSNHAHTAVF